MFESPFPPFISFCCLEEGEPSLHPVLAEEAACLSASAVEKRKKEFAMGRSCAHQALDPFGMAHVPILKHKNRAPIWPESMVGTLSHASRWAAAAVGEKTKVRGIGLDLEDLDRSVNLDIQRHVCRKEEREWLSQFDPSQQDRNLKILFSAKESIFKCFFPIAEVFLNFHDAEIQLNAEDSRFEFTLLKESGPHIPVGFQHFGTFRIVEHMVLTSIWIPPIASSSINKDL